MRLCILVCAREPKCGKTRRYVEEDGIPNEGVRQLDCEEKARPPRGLGPELARRGGLVEGRYDIYYSAKLRFAAKHELTLRFDELPGSLRVSA